MKKIKIVIETFIDDNDHYENVLEDLGINNLDYDGIDGLFILEEDNTIIFSSTPYAEYNPCGKM